MNEIYQALWKDYNSINTKLKEYQPDSNEYEILLDEKDRIRKEILELERIDQETDVKISQIECDNGRERIRNVISIVTFVISTGVSIYGIRKTFKFDESATITSTLGKPLLSNLIPRKGK